MCYAKPGPRCSTHAKASLEKARAVHAEAKVVSAEQHIFLMSLPLEERRPLLDAPDGPSKRSRAGLESASEQLVVAENEFAATPAGMLDLKAQMADLEAKRGHGKAREDAAFRSLETRLERAQETRRNQMEAYRAIHGAMHPEAGEVDAPEVEDAAMAAPVKCTCIDYKYQGDCEHASPKMSAAEVESTRTDLLPTSQEASLRLHAANSRLRVLAEELPKWQAWLAEDPARTTSFSGMGSVPTDKARAESPAFEKFEDQYQEAKYEVGTAEEVFYDTPGGQAYLRRRCEETEAVMGYVTSSTSSDFDRSVQGDERRQAARKTYAVRTGKPAPEEDTNPEPPTLMYGNGCPNNCHDFAWTGKCADTDPTMARTRTLQTSISKGGSVKSMTKAMDKAASPKKTRSRLGRVLGRNKGEPVTTTKMSRTELREYSARMESRITQARGVGDDKEAELLYAERARVWAQNR
jgi:hypothetical protein